MHITIPDSIKKPMVAFRGSVSSHFRNSPRAASLMPLFLIVKGFPCDDFLYISKFLYKLHVWCISTSKETFIDEIVRYNL